MYISWQDILCLVRRCFVLVAEIIVFIFLIQCKLIFLNLNILHEWALSTLLEKKIINTSKIALKLHCTPHQKNKQTKK